MTEIKIKTFLEMQDEVIRRERQDTDNDDVRDLIKGFINARYQEVSGETKWRWKRVPRILKVINKYTTGTVAVTNNNRLFTFTGSTLTSTMKHRRIKIDGDQESYRIIAVDTSAGTAIIDNFYIGDTDTGLSFTIFKDDYGLAPDVEDIDDVTNHYSNFSIVRKSPEFIQEKFNKNPDAEGRPRFITVDGTMNYEGVALGSGSFVLGEDFLGVPLSVKAKVFPAIADQDYSVPYVAVKRIVPLDADDDEPLMSVDDRIVLVFGALADLTATLKDATQQAYWERRYEGKLKQMLTDNQETDDQLQLVVGDYWRKDNIDQMYSSVDYGTLFDSN